MGKNKDNSHKIITKNNELGDNSNTNYTTQILIL